MYLSLPLSLSHRLDRAGLARRVLPVLRRRGGEAAFAVRVRRAGGAVSLRGVHRVRSPRRLSPLRGFLSLSIPLSLAVDRRRLAGLRQVLRLREDRRNAAPRSHRPRGELRSPPRSGAPRSARRTHRRRRGLLRPPPSSAFPAGTRPPASRCLIGCCRTTISICCSACAARSSRPFSAPRTSTFPRFHVST